MLIKCLRGTFRNSAAQYVISHNTNLFLDWYFVFYEKITTRDRLHGQGKKNTFIHIPVISRVFQVHLPFSPQALCAMF